MNIYNNREPKIYEEKKKNNIFLKKGSLSNRSKNYGKEKKYINDKRDKGKIYFTECNPDSIRKINFLGENEYKGRCFACDVGCSVSRSGYSPMNYSPYNNKIKRREITPLRYRDDEIEYNEPYNIRVNRTGIENDNNYNLIEV